jgi:hypothetical protein
MKMEKACNDIRRCRPFILIAVSVVSQFHAMQFAGA